MSFGRIRNRTPQTTLLKNKRNFFLTVLEARKTEIKAPADSMSDMDPLSDS
jgi:hypothetical protein